MAVRLALGIAAWGLIGLLLSGCASYRVSRNFDPGADLQAIGSYTWSSDSTPGELDPLLVTRLRHAVANELAARGIREDARNPDVRIRVGGGVSRRVETREWGQVYYPPLIPLYYRDKDGNLRLRPQPAQYVDIQRGTTQFEYDLGELVVEILDTGSGAPLWRGRVSDLVNPDERPAQIDEAIAKMFEGFPPRRQ